MTNDNKTKAVKAAVVAVTPTRQTDEPSGFEFNFQPYGKNSDLPDSAIVVNTYEQYREVVDSWIRGDLDGTLIVIGTAGVGKSETALLGFDALGKERGDGSGVGDYAYIKGKTTQYALYMQISRYVDKPFVLDDVDEMLSDSSVTGLLKMLLETRNPKIVQWGSGRTLSDDSGLPAQVVTTSRTMILANELKSVSKNFAAVLDRATVLYFAPTAEEVHRYVGSWFPKGDDDVYQFLADRIGLAPSPSCRFYVTAAKWKRAKLPWQKMVGQQLQPSDNKAVLMREALAAITDPKTGEYVKGGVETAIAAYMGKTKESRQAAFAVKKAVELASGKVSARGAAIAEAQRKRHAERKANGNAKPTAPTDKPKSKAKQAKPKAKRADKSKDDYIL